MHVNFEQPFIRTLVCNNHSKAGPQKHSRKLTIPNPPFFLSLSPYPSPSLTPIPPLSLSHPHPVPSLSLFLSLSHPYPSPSLTLSLSLSHPYPSPSLTPIPLPLSPLSLSLPHPIPFPPSPLSLSLSNSCVSLHPPYLPQQTHADLHNNAILQSSLAVHLFDTSVYLGKIKGHDLVMNGLEEENKIDHMSKLLHHT